MSTTPRIVRNVRTSALVCRADVLRQARRGHIVRDPYTGDVVQHIGTPPTTAHPVRRMYAPVIDRLISGL